MDTTDRKFFNNNLIPEKSSLVLKTLIKIKENLEVLKSEIKGENILKISDNELKIFRKKFKEAYSEYDHNKKVESDLTSEEEKDITENRPIDLKCLFLNVEIQTLISRITNKIQREEASRLREKFELIEKETKEVKNGAERIYNKIKKETATLKESVITICSLIFMAFTFIQLNFVAFQSSKDYLVLDRIILFSGINLFLIIGIYSILSMIKTLLSDKLDNEKEENLFKKIKIVFLIFSFIFTTSLVLKYREESRFLDIENFESNKILIKELESNLNSLKKDIENLESKIVSLEAKDNLAEQKRLEGKDKRLELKEELLNLKGIVKRIEIELEKEKIKE